MWSSTGRVRKKYLSYKLVVTLEAQKHVFMFCRFENMFALSPKTQKIQKH